MNLYLNTHSLPDELLEI